MSDHTAGKVPGDHLGPVERPIQSPEKSRNHKQMQRASCILFECIAGIEPNCPILCEHFEGPSAGIGQLFCAFLFGGNRRKWAVFVAEKRQNPPDNPWHHQHLLHHQFDPVERWGSSSKKNNYFYFCLFNHINNLHPYIYYKHYIY